MSAIAALSLIAAAPQEPAGRWWFLFADAGTAWFADGLTLTSSGDIADLTYQRIHRAKQGGAMRVMIRVQVDCKDRRWRNVAVDAFDVRNRHAGSSRPDNPQWRYFLPGSNAQGLQFYACRKIEDWAAQGSSVVYREPMSVTLDMFTLMQMGVAQGDAIRIARFDRRRQLEDIRKVIEERTRGELRARLIRLYRLPAQPAA